MAAIALPIFQKAMLKVGLTGGIATGKSTVADIFKNFGAKLVDADELAREILKKDEPAYKSIISQFGNQILQDDGEIDRAKLGKIVFSNPEDLKILNNITHPQIVENEDEICKNIIKENPDSIIIVNAALLIEAGTFHRFDKIILVYALVETQIDRLVKRNCLDKNQAIARIKSQMSFEEKRRFADFIVDNDGELQRTIQQCEQIYSELLKINKV